MWRREMVFRLGVGGIVTLVGAPVLSLSSPGASASRMMMDATYITGPVQVPGGGGPAPLSEPETQALAALVAGLRPALIMSYHSAAGLVTGGPRARAMGLEATYSAAGYPAGDWTAYPVTGDFAQWAEVRQGIPIVEIELPDHESTDLGANLAGLEATLNRLVAG